MRSFPIKCTVVFSIIYCVILSSGASRPSWINPNEEEREICQFNARNRKLTDVKKDRPLSCHVMCYYDDEEAGEMYNSPNGQLCCDMVGVGPTGVCKNGKCPVGGMITETSEME